MVTKEYTVHLDQVFQGPMDLLLHLVREHEMEIHEIEISKVVDGYLAYLEGMEKLDLEIAGDFLVMAASLIAIKSRSLLPYEELDLEEELDPRDELIQRLLEYRKFRDAADYLAASYVERASRQPRGWFGDAEDDEPEREFDLGELTPWDLLATYSRLMRETLADRPHEVVTDPRPLRFYVNRVVDQLHEQKASTLSSLIRGLEGVPHREAVVGSFCALLELVRMELVHVNQGEGDSDIEIAVRSEVGDDIRARVGEVVLDEEQVEEPIPAPGEESGSSASSEPHPGENGSGEAPQG